ncbi:(2Fe-2S)-binding protein [Lutibacter maritimus]|uniref:Carbon-monoxide dehydrogenase small subunit n=1 Tax=Lutibacter maritimus TaxID=593133 RepID=A0A1I6PLE9_9FLAO|nr:(2Fe-2S)-binding protein [Lutibacter maritimus]SFS40960.1 carbon-monoxide dehydrogenase small subunit [Lutibacter maritimus]
MYKAVNFKLNGEVVSVDVFGDETLLTVIRTYLDKTGTKYGCGIGQCGACTVLIDNEAIRSCMILVEDVQNKEITTIEGLESKNGDLHPIQKAFVELDALQCGFCTPGMILNAYGLLLKNPTPTRQEVLDGMEENLCRCGSYNRIIDAILKAAKELNEKVKI